MNDEIRNKLEINKNINRGYRDLIIWRESIDLYAFVKNKLRTIESVPYKVKAQVEDSALSFSSNIAEGYCRRSLKENIQFLSVSLSSLGENYSQILALTNAGDLDISWFNEYDQKHYSLENKTLKMNQTYIPKLNNKDEWKNNYILR